MIPLNDSQLDRVKTLALDEDAGVLLIAASTAAGLEGVSLSRAVTTVAAAIGTADDYRRRHVGEASDDQSTDDEDREEQGNRLRRALTASKCLAAEWTSAALGAAFLRAAIRERLTRDAFVRAFLEALDSIPYGEFIDE